MEVNFNCDLCGFFGKFVNICHLDMELFSDNFQKYLELYSKYKNNYFCSYTCLLRVINRMDLLIQCCDNLGEFDDYESDGL